MTGPEHYRTAERLLGDRDFQDEYADAGTVRSEASVLAAAQAHATLALAAATNQSSEAGYSRAKQDEWDGVLS